MPKHRAHYCVVVFILSFAAAALLPSSANAYAPNTTTVQGILTDSNGIALPDGSYGVTFRIYDFEFSGDLLFTESQTITTRNGLFNAEIGVQGGLSDNVFAEGYCWLEVQVDGHSPMSPRVFMASAPFARSSSHWHTVPGQLAMYANRIVGIGTSGPKAALHVFGYGEIVRVENLAQSGPAGLAYVSFRTNDSLYGWVGDGHNVDRDMYLTSTVANVHLYTPAGSVLTATSTGNVGIGTTTPTEKLQVAGIPEGNISLTGNLTGYGGNSHPTLKTNGLNLFFDAANVYTGYIGYNTGFMDVSDKSMKNDIRRIDGALDKVSQINGVKFKWADDRDQGQDHIGVIAQDVEKVAPELVGQPDGIRVKAVNYGGLNALTIEAIKELKARVEQLEAELAELKKHGATSSLEGGK